MPTPKKGSATPKKKETAPSRAQNKLAAVKSKTETRSTGGKETAKKEVSKTSSAMQVAKKAGKMVSLAASKLLKDHAAKDTKKGVAPAHGKDSAKKTDKNESHPKKVDKHLEKTTAAAKAVPVAKASTKNLVKTPAKEAKAPAAPVVKEAKKEIPKAAAKGAKGETPTAAHAAALEHVNEADLKRMEALVAKASKKAKKSESKKGGDSESHFHAGGCRELSCEIQPTSAGYCRLHYIKNWKKIKRKETILKEGKLNQYIEELVSKYPEKYIEAIRQDLVNDKDFMKVIHDLELDEGIDEFDVDGESIDSLIDNIRRDVDDEGDIY